MTFRGPARSVCEARRPNRPSSATSASGPPDRPQPTPIAGYGTLYGDCVRSISSRAPVGGSRPWFLWSVMPLVAMRGERWSTSLGPAKVLSTASATDRWPEAPTPCSSEFVLGDAGSGQRIGVALVSRKVATSERVLGGRLAAYHRFLSGLNRRPAASSLEASYGDPARAISARTTDGTCRSRNVAQRARQSNHAAAAPAGDPSGGALWCSAGGSSFGE